MTPSEQEGIIAIDPNIIKANQERSAYPDIKSTFRLFLVFVLISLIIGVVVVILLISITRVNLSSSTLKSALNLVLYIITNSLIINYALRKSKKQQNYFAENMEKKKMKSE